VKGNSLDTALELIGMSREEFERNMEVRGQLQQQMKSAIDTIIRGHIAAGSAEPERVHSLANAALLNLTVSHYVGMFFDCEDHEKLKVDFVRAAADVFNESMTVLKARREQRRKEGLP